MMQDWKIVHSSGTPRRGDCGTVQWESDGLEALARAPSFGEFRDLASIGCLTDEGVAAIRHAFAGTTRTP